MDFRQTYLTNIKLLTTERIEFIIETLQEKLEISSKSRRLYDRRQLERFNIALEIATNELLEREIGL